MVARHAFQEDGSRLACVQSAEMSELFGAVLIPEKTSFGSPNHFMAVHRLAHASLHKIG